MPELFHTPRALADDPSAKNRYILSGSVSPELMHQISESLADCLASVDVGGFHQRELTHDCRKDLWWRGGFPRAFLASSDSFARRWHLDFFRTFLERDIPQLGLSIPLDRNRDVLSLDDVLNMLASYFQGFLAWGFNGFPYLLTDLKFG